MTRRLLTFSLATLATATAALWMCSYRRPLSYSYFRPSVQANPGFVHAVDAGIRFGRARLSLQLGRCTSIEKVPATQVPRAYLVWGGPPPRCGPPRSLSFRFPGLAVSLRRDPGEDFELTDSAQWLRRTGWGCYILLSVNAWFPLVLFAVYPLWRLVRFRPLRRAYRRRRGWCPACGYDLTANLSGVCPECGTAVHRAPKGAEDP
jgi:hypothetical protein